MHLGQDFLDERLRQTLGGETETLLIGIHGLFFMPQSWNAVPFPKSDLSAAPAAQLTGLACRPREWELVWKSWST